jgi:cellulose synthase/poly-beta-1,6-N-acetylglucosamine synthase-like glycosyltransferase
LDTRKARPLIIKALQECERYCREYMESREDLAYLAAFRSKVRVSLHEEEEDEESSRLAPEGTDRHLAESHHQETVKVSMNLFLCVKYKNSGKLSSHNWFFNGFCKELRPRYSVLLDVGLKPDG